MSRRLNFLFNQISSPLRFINFIIPWNCSRKRHLSWKSLLIYFILIIIPISLFITIERKKNLIEKFLESSLDKDSIVQCRLPKLSLSIDGLRYADHKMFNPNCRSTFNPISISNFSVRLIEKNVDCNVLFYLGEGDRHYRERSIPLPYNLNVSLLSDHFLVKCIQSNIKKSNSSSKQFISRTLPVISIRYDENVRRRLRGVTKTKDDYNILILSLDSVSRLQFQRMLPKTYNYITNDLNGFVLKGYNILGDGTPAQIIPLLTGMQERELPSTLHRDKNGAFVDVYPFLWNKYRSEGYVTGYAEDGPNMGIWTLRLRGFKKTPTDHYMLPFYRLPATRSHLYAQNSYCFGNETSFEMFLSYIKQFWKSYPQDKKFFFAFFKQFTHNDYSRGSLLDGSILNLLIKLRQSKELERTVVIVMTDHGARFSSARRSPQGNIEERLPFMSLILPSSLHEKYPSAINALRTNIDRFTTPFDVYATLLSLFNLNKTIYSKEDPLTERSISLFKIISSQRTCDHIKLPPHWCSCLQWESIKKNDNQIQKVANHILNYLNDLFPKGNRLICHRLNLESIDNAQMYRPNKNFSVPLEEGVKVLSHWRQASDVIFYQITFRTKPNGAIYEATTQYQTKTNQFNTHHTHISRLNAYGSAADCIVKSHPHLRKFCSCIQ